METFQAVVAWALIILGGFFFGGQLISTLNFRLAQSLGLQEKSENADTLANMLELMAARWDSLSIWLAPLAGILILVDHVSWPAAALVAGGVYVDAGGREWAKIAGLNAHGMAIGSARERAMMYGTYVVLIFLGLAAILLGLARLL